MDRELYLALVNDKIDVLKGIMDSKLYSPLADDNIDDQRTPANNTVLHLACQHGSIQCVKEILIISDHNEALLLQPNSRGETCLHLAARQGHYYVVITLISKAMSMVPQPNDLENTSSTILQNLIRARNVEFETALHAAVRYGHEKVVELLVKEDPSYSYHPNKYDETPLYLAAVRCYAGVTKVILDNCESPTYGGPHGRTALHAALMNKSGYECMKLLLEKNKDLIKVADNNGWTAFHFVAHNNLKDLVEYLLNVDKSVAYLADKRYKRTAIHVAAYQGHKSVLKKFLKCLPDVWESVDGNDQNILHIAVTQDHKSVAYLADEKYKRTPLHVAAYKGNVSVMKEFMKYLPDGWESLDGNGQNILHIAITQDHKSVINFILSEFDKQSALLIQRDKEGNTPLHLIAKFGFYFPQLHHTNDWKADWDIVNNANFTPRDVLHQRQTATQSHEALVGVTVDRTGVNHWNQWIQEQEVQRVSPTEEDAEPTIQRYREMANSHMVVAALITTVALTAGFAMPGGFDGNPGPKQGSAVLLRKSSFKTFMVADAVALLFSISSLFLYFITQFNISEARIYLSVVIATVSNVVSITAMMVAFNAGTYAVLPHSSGLTIIVSIISSLFLFLVFYVTFRCFRHHESEDERLKNIVKSSL